MENQGMQQGCTTSNPEFTWANYDASVRCTSGVRFLSEDPIGFEAGINFYAYVNNNPLRFNDPMGLDVGDVYAFTPDGGPFSDPIGNAIASADAPYSHIAIELTGGRLLEATRAGVNIVDLAKTLNGRDFDVFRSVDFNSESIPGLENFADFADGAPYDFGAFAGQRDTTNCAYICSTLVNDAAEFSGFGSFSIPGDFITSPSDIIFSDDFQLIDTSSFNGGASGGFVLYPSHINTNQMQSIYSK